MKLVCITGIDGAGKSTLARNTVAALREESIPAVYVYGRTYPVLSRALMALGRLALLRGKDQWRDYTAYAASKNETMKNPVLGAIYTATILFDYYLQLGYKLAPHLASGRIVVADRYVYDTVISDLAVHLGYTMPRMNQVLERCLRFAPKPLLTALVDLPAEVAFSRKDDVPHVDFLRDRQRWYRQLGGRPEVIKLDGEAPPDTLVRRLVAELAVRDRSVELKGSQP